MERRTFLRSAGLAIAMPATVALPTVAASPETPEERGQGHWAAFAQAMDEIAGDTHGWLIHSGRRKPYKRLAGGGWGDVTLIHYADSDDPRFPNLVTERHQWLPMIRLCDV